MRESRPESIQRSPTNARNPTSGSGPQPGRESSLSGRAVKEGGGPQAPHRLADLGRNPDLLHTWRVDRAADHPDAAHSTGCGHAPDAKRPDALGSTPGRDPLCIGALRGQTANSK